VILCDYDRFGTAWELAGDTLTPASGLCHGHVRVKADADGRLCALYAQDGRLWLQIGARRWDTDQIVLRLDSGLLAITGPDKAVIRYALPQPDPFDPTYDAIDAMEDDIFLWLSDRLASPISRTQMLGTYAAGFRPRGLA
jgi:hypothetical protein